MSWSEWQSIDSPSGHDAPAVYELRMTIDDSGPLSVPRFLATDDGGLLSIGETGNMESRRKQFIYAVEKRSGHSEGNLLCLLLRHSPLKARFPKHRVEFRFRPETDKQAAKTAEARLIKEYIREFGEVPPLNSAIPDRYGSWDPEDLRYGGGQIQYR